MEVIKHVVFNPTSFSYNYSPLGVICKTMEEEGWVLYKIIPHHQYESVAIFIKMIEVKAEEEEVPETEEHEGGYI